MNKEIAKAKATALRTYMDSLGIKINHSHALEAVARMEGETCYNTLQAKFVDIPRLAPEKSVPAIPQIDPVELSREYRALAQACLESQDKLGMTAESAVKGGAPVDGFLPGELDPRAGFMWAYRKGRLVVSTSYQSNRSVSYLIVHLHEVDKRGEQVGEAVDTLCTPLRETSDIDTRRNFVAFLGESLGSAEFASLSVSEMRPALEAFCASHAFLIGGERHAAILERLRAIVAAKGSPVKNWEIDVCRKEMADVTVVVHNATRREAENEAIGEASSRDLDAHETDYLLADGDLHADDPKVGTVEGDDGSRASWEISVRRISYGFLSIPVEGVATKELAEMHALDEANEHEFFNTSDRHIVKTIKKL